jgi:hypothetical protein
MSDRKPGRVLLFAAAVCVTTWLASPTARAETRTYLDLDVAIAPSVPNAPPPQLRLFGREENRFRNQGLVLNKAFAGARLSAFPWLQLAPYYAKKDMFYGKHVSKHMAVMDLLLTAKLGRLRGKYRLGNEWHVTDSFYRLRNYAELAYVMPLPWLSAWTAEEFRIDSDQQRVNVNDVRLGLGVRAKKRLQIRPFVDVESSRRGKPSWEHLTFVGIAFAAKV